jgi:hypothetical protein
MRLSLPLVLTACVAAASAPAAAQVAPGEPTAGIIRGLQSQNSSAQVGTVSVFPSSKRIVVDVHGANGRNQAVTLNRERRCSDDANAQVAVLGYLAPNGRLTATSPLPSNQLLSGNFSVVVHNNKPGSRPVACGQLFLR